MTQGYVYFDVRDVLGVFVTPNGAVISTKILLNNSFISDYKLSGQSFIYGTKENSTLKPKIANIFYYSGSIFSEKTQTEFVN